ncbi:MAG: SagB/ThcOx family dehydrogenase [Anaerocolumna sp.]
MERYKEQRNFLKSNFSEFKKIKTDKAKGVPQPLAYKPYKAEDKLIKLPEITEDVISNNHVYQCIKERRSTRLYAPDAMSLLELSYLLWATQGVTGVNKAGMTLRTVPCSGATYTFETYIFAMNITGLDKGVYRYLPLENKLVYLFELDEMEEKVDALTLEQPFVPNFAKKAAAVFAWSTTPYRSEWKFDITAHKKILIDIGHVCQNLYIAGESVDAGTCAIGIYDQQMIDEILGLDGEEEFIIYLAAVGKKRN